MAQKKLPKAELSKRKQKRAFDTLIERSESFLGQLQERKAKPGDQPPGEDPALIARRKRKVMFFAGGGVACILTLIYSVHWLVQPTQGTVRYGACRNFLEMYVQYPDYLRLAYASERPEAGYDMVRIWYSRLDGFGQYNMERMQCYFSRDEQGNIALEKILVGMREIDAADVQRFNAALPAILRVDTDLSYPLDFPDNIADLKFDADAFRKPLFGRRRR